MATRVQVGPFLVDDLTSRELVTAAAERAVSADKPQRIYALHVGGLNCRADAGFVAEMRAAELVYADGISVVTLGRLIGATSLERSPTTDIGWDILREVGLRQGRPARIALIGGPEGLAVRAGEVLHAGGAGDVVFASDGYRSEWSGVLDEMRSVQPDVCLVGLGAPREMLWVGEHLQQLPHGLVVTCGGWFGFLTGAEKRAPRLVQKLGLEWTARLAQSPHRLATRYARGLLTTLAIGTQTLTKRQR